MKKTCPVCTKEYNTSHSKGKYCSIQCFSKRNKNNISLCVVCKKTLITYPNWIKRGGGKYCSVKCRGIDKRNRVNRNCQICGKIFTVKSSSIVHSGAKYCSHACMNKGQRGKEKPSIQGEKHCNWKNGASRQLYPLKFNDELKDNIRKRDGYNCQLCNLQDEEHILIYGYSLMVHHIDYIKDNCEDSNLISLCNQCHGRTNYNRAYWTEFFKSKVLLRTQEVNVIKRVFTVLLLMLVLSVFAMPAFAATDIWDVGAWKIDSTGALIPGSTGSQQVDYENFTAGDTLVTADSGKLIVYSPTVLNTAGTFELPGASVGLEYSFTNAAIGTTTIHPLASDTIMYLTMDAGDRITSPAATGDSITLTCYKANYWAVRNRVGTFTDGGA